jgi:hypothetical protein
MTPLATRRRRDAQLPVCFISAFYRENPEGVIHDFKNDAIIADAEAITIGPRQRFRELERIGLRGVQAHFRRNAFAVLRGQLMKLLLCSRRVNKPHIPR